MRSGAAALLDAHGLPLARLEPHDSGAGPVAAASSGSFPAALPLAEPLDPAQTAAKIEDGRLLAGLLAAVQQLPGDPGDLVVIGRAFAVARRAHEGQARRSGEPYLAHPVRVAHLIASLGLDAEAIAAALLHDAVEDSELTVLEVEEGFGPAIAALVDGVTKLGKVPFLSRQERQAESFRKLLLAMSKDIRVLLVKLADRLDNMRSLAAMPRAKRDRISRETREIYVPLAGRLGIEPIRRELEELAFAYLEPAAHAEVEAAVARVDAAHPAWAEARTQALRAAFSGELQRVFEPETAKIRWPEAEHGPIAVRSTRRSLREIQADMEGDDGEGRALEPGDLWTFQVITRDRAACYAALGVLHGVFTPVPGHFRDYVALPRPNQYRALHTRLLDAGGQPLEVQVRSRWMDGVAERGIVAEWRAGADRPGSEARRLAWLAELMDWQRDVRDPSEFIDAVKADLFAEEVYVFSPAGDLFTFPRGATAIDFAFAVHTDVGMRCSGARVNGQVVPLRYRLREGDSVEIITSPTAAPRKEWLDLCVTSRARSKIRYELRQVERERLRDMGRSLLDQALRRRGGRLEDAVGSGRLMVEAANLGLVALPRDPIDRGAERGGESGVDERGFEGRPDADAVYEAVASGRLVLDELVDALSPRRRPGVSDMMMFTRMFRWSSGRRGARGEAEPVPAGELVEPMQLTLADVRPGATGDARVRLAGCCRPVPGDDLVGWFEPGRGFVAHVQGCPQGVSTAGGQRIPMEWQPGVELESQVTLEVRTTNQVGLLAAMSRVFSGNGVNIRQANCRAYDQGQRAINTFEATVTSAEQLEALTIELKGIPGVLAVQRVFGGKGA